MNSIALFTQQELAAAFRLIVSEQEAERRAAEFFQFHDVSVAGYLLWEPPPTPPVIPGLIIGSTPKQEITTGGYEVFAGKSDQEKGEFLLSFSDFTLNLVSLVSNDIAKRIQTARNYSDEKNERALRQMKSIVNKMRE